MQNVVEQALASTPFIDIHTHLFAPQFGPLGLCGIDELLTYHYLEAELFRFSSVRPEAYWSLQKHAQADLIWQTLFVENTPASEATRGVVAVLQALGLDAAAPHLQQAREYFQDRNEAAHLTNVLRLAGVDRVVMTNDPLDPAEAAVWQRDPPIDPRFQSALRLDRILNQWETHHPMLYAQGYRVEAAGGGATPSELRRFLDFWIARMQPRYMAVSLPDTFTYPEAGLRSTLLREAVLPACRERRIPISLMIGVRRAANPLLRLAGDASGRADLTSLAALCRDFPENKFLVSVLSRENQHELCVYARKFANLMPFGCWWFLNNPSMVEEITRERIEMLGMSFIPQHSDARILEQIIYKWRNTRRTLAPILAKTYETLAEDGRKTPRSIVERDIRKLFRTNFESWTTPA